MSNPRILRGAGAAKSLPGTGAEPQPPEAIHRVTKENLLRSLPVALSGDPKMVALAEAVAGVLALRLEEINRVSIYPHINRLDEGLLDILARDFKVDWWDSGYSVEEKRRTLQSSWQVHKTLGTKAAVERAVRAIYPETRVAEWFDYGGRPYHFRLHINVTGDEMDSAKQRRVLGRLEYYKNLRSHLDGVTYFMQSETAQAWAGALAFSEYRRNGGAAALPDAVGWPRARLTAHSGAAFLGTAVRICAKTPPITLEWPKVKTAATAGAAGIHIYKRVNGNIQKGT